MSLIHQCERCKNIINDKYYFNIMVSKHKNNSSESPDAEDSWYEDVCIECARKGGSIVESILIELENPQTGDEKK